MTEIELKRLKDMPVPLPRNGAKRAACAAAFEAFDGADDEERPATKENSSDPRLTSTPHPAVRRKFMQFSRSQYAMAASLAALIVAAPIAFRMNDSGLDGISARDAFKQAIPLALKPQTRDGGEVVLGELSKSKVADKKAASPLNAVDRKKEDSVAIPGFGRLDRPEPIATEQKSANAQPPATGFIDVAPTKPIVPPVFTTAAPPAAEPAPIGGADLNAAVGEKMIALPRAVLPSADDPARMTGVAPGYNAYYHMEEADKQKALVEQEYRDKFEAIANNPVKQVASEPVSTFSIDVDTASYAFVRRSLNQGRLPPKDAVRVEEMINYFPYAYPRPETAETPFQPTVSVMPSPWNPNNQLVHIGIKGYDLTSTERPRANLVFLMDVSGSMKPADRLPLAKNAFRMLVEDLKPDDTVAIVTYASGSGVLLEPTKISDKSKILKAIDQLGAGGSTAGADGIQDAYRLAESNFDKAAVNRVILATDGDFNVGITDQDDLKGLIERKREAGIFLSILGVGEGNYNDALMQTLAQNGNGTAAHVDTLSEARKVLVEESSSTLFTIAKDVKIQVEWNPARVSEYRLVGYETRALKREDFNNDKVDAGDIGSGHTVTVIYEITPAGSEQKLVEDLRYSKAAKTAAAQPAEPVSGTLTGEFGFLKLRYKLPKEEASQLTTIAISDALVKESVTSVPDDARFSVAVAAFGQLLKGAPYTKGLTYDDVIALAQSAKGNDPFGYRAEFVSLVRLAKSAQP